MPLHLFYNLIVTGSFKHFDQKISKPSENDVTKQGADITFSCKTWGLFGFGNSEEMQERISQNVRNCLKERSFNVEDNYEKIRVEMKYDTQVLTKNVDSIGFDWQRLRNTKTIEKAATSGPNSITIDEVGHLAKKLF